MSHMVRPQTYVAIVIISVLLVGALLSGCNNKTNLPDVSIENRNMTILEPTENDSESGVVPQDSDLEGGSE